MDKIVIIGRVTAIEIDLFYLKEQKTGTEYECALKGINAIDWDVCIDDLMLITGTQRKLRKGEIEARGSFKVKTYQVLSRKAPKEVFEDIEMLPLLPFIGNLCACL